MDFNKIFGPFWFILGIVSASVGVLTDNISLVILGMVCYVASLIHGMKELMK